MRTLARVQAKEELRTLAYEFGVDWQMEGGTLKELAGSLVRATENLEPTEKAEEGLVRLVKYAFKHVHVAFDNPLVHALRVDGFEWNGSTLVPTTPSPAALGPETTTLERQLKKVGFEVARTHYRQSYDSFVDGRWEACNGQIRSFMEDLLIQAGKFHSGKPRDDPQAALGDLRSSLLEDSEWNFARSLWSILHTSGAHRGLSECQKSLFRLHVATAFARYLLGRVCPTSQTGEEGTSVNKYRHIEGAISPDRPKKL